MEAYKEKNEEMRPLVRFANGMTQLIPAIASASLRGGANVMEQYTVCRTQIPLTLAWALSIHKSQGMTLDFVEVSSKDIFETGQLYVALSRATHLDGLRLTGFERKQIPTDKDALEFYTTTKWEKLEGRGRKK
jgi:ATP-dependent DNA helicase PIF1